MKHRSAKLWRRVSATAAFATPAFLALDTVEHFWVQGAITAVGGSATWYFGRKNARHEAARERAAHRPDYAKIARLEVELGLVDPPKPPPAPKPVNASSVFNLATNLFAPKPSPQTREMVAAMRAPDQHCGLCLPGGPPYGHYCPFYPVCQDSTGRRKKS